MPRPIDRRLAVTAVAFVLFAACGGGDDDGNGNGNVDEDGNGPGGSTAELTVEAVDFGFQPNELNVDGGAQVNLEFSNGGEAPHTFTAEDIDVDVRLDPGGSETITFSAPDDSTEVEWMCTIHPQMTGTLVVGGGSAASDPGDDMNSDGGLDY